MIRSVAIKGIAFALLVAGAAVGVADAQVITVTPTPRRTGYCPGGPFTLVGGEVKFHVALDDRQMEPVGLVLMRLIDQDGAVVTSQTVSLRPGQTATLEFRGRGLLLRAQAETFETAGTLSDRRRVVGSVELFERADGFRAVIPVMCVPNENIGR